MTLLCESDTANLGSPTNLSAPVSTRAAAGGGREAKSPTNLSAPVSPQSGGDQDMLVQSGSAPLLGVSRRGVPPPPSAAPSQPCRPD